MGFLVKSELEKLEQENAGSASDLADATRAYESAAAAVQAPPIELSDDQIAELINKRNAAETKMVSAKAKARRAEHALTEFKVKQAERDREAEIATVKQQGAAAVATARKELASAAKAIRNSLRIMAEADLARLALNRNLPSEMQVASFEGDLFGDILLPQQEISRSSELFWIHWSGSPVDKADQISKVRETSSYDAFIPRDVGDPFRLAHKQYYDRVTFLPEVKSPHRHSLAQSVSMPEIDGAPGWKPMRNDMPATAAAILDKLNKSQEVEITRKLAGRQEMERLVPVSPIFNSLEEQTAWEQSRSQRDAAKAVA